MGFGFKVSSVLTRNIMLPYTGSSALGCEVVVLLLLLLLLVSFLGLTCPVFQLYSKTYGLGLGLRMLLKSPWGHILGFL